MSRPVRVSDKGHEILVELAKEDKKSMSDVLEKVLLAEKRRRFFEGINAGYEELKKSPSDWKEELEERDLYENTLMDGVKDEPIWSMEIKGEVKSNDKTK